MHKSLLFILVFFSSHTSFARDLEVGWELWFPYQYRNKAQELVGLDLEIFKAVLKNAGLTANYVELPWKRHLRYIKSGKIDIAFGASYTKERDEYAYFTEAYRIETVKLFVKKGSKLQLAKLNELANSPYIIGIETGYYYGDEFARLMKQPKFEQHINEVIDIEQNISMLLKGRIDGLLADPNTVRDFIEKYRITNELAVAPVEIYQAKIYMMLSRKSLTAPTLKKFNQSIRALKADGTLAAILAK
jgi:polar amino acid transport system substrate-binding protein